jgi:predicted nuclease of predicted toxin-antitoxin system
MDLLIDENVPDDVVVFLRSRGHNTEMVRKVLPVGTEDPVVAAVGNKYSKTIVTWDKGFGKMANVRSNAAQGNQSRYRKLSQILFDCKYTQGLEVIKDNIGAIEEYYSRAASKRKKLLVTLRVDGISLRWR